jgi:hypothetical protein
MCGIKSHLEHRKEQQTNEKILEPILVLMRREYNRYLERTLEADRPPADERN